MSKHVLFTFAINGVSVCQEMYGMATCGPQVHDLDSGAQVLARYRELVEKGRKQFAQELESLTPDVKLGSRCKSEFLDLCLIINLCWSLSCLMCAIYLDEMNSCFFI